MPGLFSPESTSISSPSSFGAGFSETGQATSVNVNLSGKIKARGSISPVITLTDQGAIAKAQDLASQSIRSIELLGSNLNSLLTSFASELRAQGNDAIAAVSEANRTELENIAVTVAKWGALALGGFFLLRALTVKA